MTTDRASLVEGIAAAKAGDKATARRLLTRAVRQAPESVDAWFWLAAVLDTSQGRLFCLDKVLSLNPDHRLARRGRNALVKVDRAPAIVAREAPPKGVQQPTTREELVQAPAIDRDVVQELRARLLEEPAAPPEEERVGPPPGGLLQQQRFWQVVVACMAVVAVCLLGILAYAALGRTSAADEATAVVLVTDTPTPRPRGTLRPTFTPSPTNTPLPTDTPTSTPIPTDTPTFTPTPTETLTPIPTATPRPPQRVAPALTTAPTVPANAAPTPVPLPPRSLDPRLPSLGVRIEPVFVEAGKLYYRLVEARWGDERESGGKHSIYVEVLDVRGDRIVGRPVVVQWADGSIVLPVEDLPPPDWGVNFPMYNTLGSYAVSVGGAPSDRIVGMGLGTAEAPDFTIHTTFYLVFRQTYR
jgi:hypothetical protein